MTMRERFEQSTGMSLDTHKASDYVTAWNVWIADYCDSLERKNARLNRELRRAEAFFNTAIPLGAISHTQGFSTVAQEVLEAIQRELLEEE